MNDPVESSNEKSPEDEKKPEVGSIPYNPANTYDSRDLVERLFVLRADPVMVHIFRARDIATGDWGPITVQMTYDGMILAMLPWSAAQMLIKAMSYVDPEAPRDVRGVEADRIWAVEKKDFNFLRHEVMHMAQFLARSIEKEIRDHPTVSNCSSFRELADGAVDSLNDLYQHLGNEESMALMNSDVD